MMNFEMTVTACNFGRRAAEKALGNAGAGSERVKTAADAHGIDRLSSGGTLIMVISEYRALRASVVHLWNESNPQHTAGDFYDLTRFGESIDQSVAEAVRSYTQEADRLLQQVEKKRLELEAQIQKDTKAGINRSASRWHSP